MKQSKKIFLLILIITAALVIFPYLLSILILPGRTDPNAEYFKGEWFNRYYIEKTDFTTLDRWAHYYGYHGCEPEDDNCPYRGPFGKWKLLISYLTEKKTFPKSLLQPPVKKDSPREQGDTPPEVRPKEINGLIRIKDVDSSIVIDLKYATNNNFTGQVIYPAAIGILQKATAEKLAKANKELLQYGYRIKVWDAYRPLDAQRVLWDAAPDKYYVADPSKGSKHNRGAAVDLTLVDMQGKEVEMPTEFDDFSERAHRDSPNMSKEAAKNLGILTDVMARSGFTFIHREWWHYEDKDWEKYPLLNIKPEEFLPPQPPTTE